MQSTNGAMIYHLERVSEENGSLIRCPVQFETRREAVKVASKRNTELLRDFIPVSYHWDIIGYFGK